MSSDEEPDWVIEQSSAQKARLQESRISDSASCSAIDSEPEVEAAPAGEKKKDGGERKKKGAPSSRLPLLLAPKVRRDMVLVEAPDPSIDLSGDFGCIGRLHFKRGGKATAEKPASEEPVGVAKVTRSVLLDLKGKLYDGDIVPSTTLCLLAIDGSKARIEAVCSDFVRLDPPRDSIFDQEAVQTGELGADFFDDGDNYNSGGSDSEEIGPLKEGGAKAKKNSKAKPRKSKAPGAKGGSGRGGPSKGGAKGGTKKPPAAGGKRALPAAPRGANKKAKTA